MLTVFYVSAPFFCFSRSSMLQNNFKVNFLKIIILVTIETPPVQMKNRKPRARRSPDNNPITPIPFSKLLVGKIKLLSLERVVQTDFIIKRER